jgi:hypothetical protein
MKKLFASFAILILCFAMSVASAAPSGTWRLDTRGASGPIVQSDLPDAKGKRRTVFVAVEYARQCDPTFSYTEITGNGLGAPTSQTLLKNTKIGVVLNGKFYTWHAARTSYVNGYEAGFGVPNELLLKLLTDVDTLAYVTPPGETIELPTVNFQQALQAAINVCRRQVK